MGQQKVFGRVLVSYWYCSCYVWLRCYNTKTLPLFQIAHYNLSSCKNIQLSIFFQQWTFILLNRDSSHMEGRGHTQGCWQRSRPVPRNVSCLLKDENTFHLLFFSSHVFCIRVGCKLIVCLNCLKECLIVLIHTCRITRICTAHAAMHSDYSEQQFLCTVRDKNGKPKYNLEEFASYVRNSK